METIQGYRFAIDLDDGGVARKFSEIKNEAKLLKSSMQANFATIRSGEGIMAAYAQKVNDAGRAIEGQKAVIARLKQEQNGLDLETQKGREAYVKYENQINAAKRSIESLESQQTKARQSLEIQKSGIIALTTAMKQRDELSNAYVKRLESEGNHEKAVIEQRDNAKKSIKETNQALEKERDLLEKMGKNGSSDSAINKQKIAVEKLKTSLNESKKAVSGFDNELKQINPTPFQRIKNGLSGINREGKKTHSIFKSVFAANIISNGFSSAVGAISGKLKEAMSASMEYARAQQTMNASWLTLTGNAKEGKKMVSMTNEMAASFANSTDMVNDLNQKFYSISNNSGVTKKLTTDVLTLQDAFGKTDDEVKNFSTQYSQMMANGKVSAQDMMSFVNVFPKIRTELLETEKKISGNHSLSMKQLNDMISAGDVSSKTMQEVMDGMQKKYSGATANFGKTFDGMNRTITARVPALMSAFTTPLLNMQNPFLGTISKWVSDPKTEKSFGKLGDVASKGLSKITTAFSKALNINTGSNNSEKFFTTMSNSITSMADLISKHAKDIVGFFKGLWSSVKIIGSIGTGFFKGIIDGVGAVAKPLAKLTGGGKSVNSLSSALEALSKQKGTLETFGKVLAGIFITKKVFDFASSIVHVGTKIKNFAKDVKENARIIRDSLKWTAKLVTKGAKKGLDTFLSISKSTGRGIGKALKWTAKVSRTGATKAISLLSKTAKGTGKIIGKSLKFTAKVSSAAAIKALSGLRKAALLTGKAFLQMGKFMLANPFVAIAAAVVAIGVGLYELYKHNKKFRDMVNGWGKAISNFTKNIIKNVTKFFKNFGKNWDKFWNGIGKGIGKTWKGITGGINKQYKNITKGFSSFGKKFSKGWNKYWSDTGKKLSKSWKSMGKSVDKFNKDTNKNWNKFKRSFSKSWNKHWNSTKKYLGDRWNDMRKSSSGWGDNMSKWVGSWGDTFKKAWSNIVDSVKKTFGGLWDEMKKLAGDGINAVSGVINNGINGINGIIHTFGGSKKTIGTIPKVHFATGTGSLNGTSFRRAINQITPAVVNDEPGAKNPELIFRKATRSVEYMKGTNANTVLFPGDEVANASDSARLAPMFGLSHFANGGIGDFFGGIWNGVKGFASGVSRTLSNLWDIGTKIVKNPMQALESLMPFSNNGAKGFFPTIVKGGYKFAKKQISEWWKALWSMVNFDGGAWASSPGKGWSVTSGFGNRGAVSGGYSAHDGVDYSGGKTVHAMHGNEVWYVGGAPAGWGGDKGIGESVVTKARDAYVIYQELNGKYNSGASILVKKGDHVKPGDPIARLGPSGNHVHVGVSKTNPFSHSGTTTAGWLDVTKMKSTTGNITDILNDVKADNPIKRLVKSQVGSGFWKMISKIATQGFENGGFVNQHQMIEVGERNLPEAIVPLDLSKSSRTYQILGQIVTRLAGRESVVNTSPTYSEKSDEFKRLEDKFDILIGMFSQLLGINVSQLTAIKATGFNKQDWYKQQAKDQSSSDYQSL